MPRYDAAIARMVLVLPENMGLAVIAEGVDTQTHRKARLLIEFLAKAMDKAKWCGVSGRFKAMYLNPSNSALGRVPNLMSGS